MIHHVIRMATTRQTIPVFEALNHLGRRRLLMALLTNDMVDPSEYFEGRKENVEVQLNHNHLPKLEEAGFIKWDRENGIIYKGENWEQIEPLLTLMNNHKDELPDDYF